MAYTVIPTLFFVSGANDDQPSNCVGILFIIQLGLAFWRRFFLEATLQLPSVKWSIFAADTIHPNIIHMSWTVRLMKHLLFKKVLFFNLVYARFWLNIETIYIGQQKTKKNSSTASQCIKESCQICPPVMITQLWLLVITLTNSKNLIPLNPMEMHFYCS